MSPIEIENLLHEQMLCRIAFKGAKYPYLAPFQYTVIDGSLYFHFTDYGKKMRLLERNQQVCVEIEKYTPNLSEYQFVVLRGELEVVQDPHERVKAVEKIAEEGKQKLSPNFLAAHGFQKEDGWAVFTPDKPVMIVKLARVSEEIGLKAPL
jgi:nitroimidazol reductase NimA-like FMN-containing flavoprotein (pyridoxamine 5'-phosphate oxidase superfamily)